VGVLCKQSGRDDVVDASVVLLARRLGAKIVTSDSEDLSHLDPSIELILC
jgi:predicted SpoU family rRNA methylase